MFLDGKVLNKKNVFYIIILILFIVLSSYISFYHEYWADEANAWLISRDSTIYNLFFKYLHADGHPALWHLIIKCFQFFGLKYCNFRFISLFFSAIGVGLLLFKSKFKWYLKVLLPFTYFIFYQYTVIVRGYCLILPLLSLIAIMWNDRYKKCFFFTFLLILLISLEAYTFVLSGSIFLLYIYDFYKSKDELKNKKSIIICFCLLVLFFIFTIIYVYPDSTFSPVNPNSYYLSLSFFASYKWDFWVKFLEIFFFCFMFLGLRKNGKKNNIQLVLLLLPLISFMHLKYYNVWHLGICFLAFLFYLWINNIYDNKIINVLLIISSCVQIYWSISASIYDLKNDYSPSYKISEFIKKYDYKNLKIYGFGYYESGINAYFDKNIFDNWDKEIGFFYWNKDNVYYENNKGFVYKDYDIIIFTLFFEYLDIVSFKEDYNVYEFKSHSYAEDFVYEDLSAYVLVRKKIDNY